VFVCLLLHHHRPQSKSPHWHVPLANFTANLRQAVGSLQQLGVRSVMLITPPPVGVRHPKDPVSGACQLSVLMPGRPAVFKS
jgi:hypothetical protein